MFDFPQPGVGNSGALCEVVRSLRPKTAPFFADPWQQICGNDIVSCWVITHNSDRHILQLPGKKWRGEKKRITLKHWRKMTGEMSSTWSATLKKNHSCSTLQREQLFYSALLGDVAQDAMAADTWDRHKVVSSRKCLFLGRLLFFRNSLYYYFSQPTGMWLTTLNKCCGFKWLKPKNTLRSAQCWV